MLVEQIGSAGPRYTIAVIGGTGPQGKGLGYRFARHGHDVVLGSRSADKARVAAGEVADRLVAVEGAGTTDGATNEDAVAAAEVVLLAVPYDGHDELVASLKLGGKTVISCVNPLAFDKRGAHGRAINGGGGLGGRVRSGTSARRNSRRSIPQRVRRWTVGRR